MERLRGAHERLDGPLDDPDVLAGNLRDLRRINRLLGGARLTRRAVDALWPDDDDLHVLDVGTGAADIPIALLADARRRRRQLRVTAVDSRPEVVAAARALRPTLDRVPGLRLDVADGRALPFPDAAFDVAHASLVLHHLDEADAAAFLGELRRVARRGVVVNDLARGRLAWLGARALTLATTRNPFTRADAPLSVRRAYTAQEAIALAAEAGLATTATFHGPLGHRWAIAAVPR